MITKKKQIQFFTMGDFLLRGSSEELFSQDLADVLKSTDFNFVNYEAPVITKNDPITKAGPSINQLARGIDELVNNNFKLLTLANNHIGDYGDEGIINTIAEIQKRQIEFIGVGENDPESFKEYIYIKDNYKIGIIAVAENGFGALSYNNRGNVKYGYAWINSTNLAKKIIETRSKVDLLVLSVHAGLEGAPVPLKIWKNKYRDLCDLGVDLLIGHHPHVPQGVEKYKKSFIFYSLGNSYFDFPKETYIENISFGVLFTIDTVSGNISFEKIPLLMNGKLTINNDERFMMYLDKLDEALLDKYNELESYQNKYCYSTIYTNYLKICLNIPQNLKERIKKELLKILCILRLKQKSNEATNVLLQHLFMIESHSYVIQEGLHNSDKLYSKEIKNEYDELFFFDRV